VINEKSNGFSMLVFRIGVAFLQTMVRSLTLTASSVHILLKIYQQQSLVVYICEKVVLPDKVEHPWLS